MTDTFCSKNKSGNPWLIGGLILLVVIALGAMCLPVVMKRTCRNGHMTAAISNAKQVFYLLVEFDQDFGQFPNDVTAAGDLDLQGYHGKFSNDYLAQFIAGGYTTSEEIFYAKGGSSSIKTPDNVISHRGDQLSAGECGFAYIKGLSTKSLSDTPILLTPMSGDGYQFKAGIHNGKAVVLRVDGAVKQYRLNSAKRAVIEGRKTLFNDGANSMWGAKGFDQNRLKYAK